VEAPQVVGTPRTVGTPSPGRLGRAPLTELRTPRRLRRAPVTGPRTPRRLRPPSAVGVPAASRPGRARLPGVRTPCVPARGGPSRRSRSPLRPGTPTPVLPAAAGRGAAGRPHGVCTGAGFAMSSGMSRGRSTACDGPSSYARSRSLRPSSPCGWAEPSPAPSVHAVGLLAVAAGRTACVHLATALPPRGAGRSRRGCPQAGARCRRRSRAYVANVTSVRPVTGAVAPAR
jgi:hypothetical protein